MPRFFVRQERISNGSISIIGEQIDNMSLEIEYQYISSIAHELSLCCLSIFKILF